MSTSLQNPTLPPGDGYQFPPAAIGWYSTVLLALLYWLSLLDRSIISLMVDPIKNDLGISDVQFGMLHGLAFAITFSFFGLMAGTLADRFSRRWIIFASVSIWSLATAACGLAQSFWHMLIARIGVGAGEAGLNPCATSIITDLFPPEKLTMALAIYSLGASVGAGCAFLFGGILIDALSESSVVILPLLGEVSPWQAVFIIIGIPGLLIALLSFTMPEPKRLGVRKKQVNKSAFRSVIDGNVGLVKFMGQRRKFFFHHYLGFGLGSLCFTGGQAWYPAHMARTFGWEPTQIGLAMGLTMIIAGFAGKFLCGFSVGAIYRRGYRDAQFRWYAICLLVAAPLGVIATTSDDPVIFLGGFGLFMMLLSPITAVYVSSLNLVTPNELRGIGVAFFSATVGLLALSIGPILIAGISDYVLGGNSIGQAIAIMIGVGCPIAALALMTGRKAMTEAVHEAENWTEEA